MNAVLATRRGAVVTVLAATLSVSLLLPAGSARADVRLPSVIGSHMVIQRGVPAPIWGWADAGEKVTVEFAGQRLTTTADDDGAWSVRLAPIGASSTPRAMTVSGKNTLTLDDVVVGEVWVCSGQSNMAWSVQRALSPEREIAAANYAHIRLITVPRRPSREPQKDFDGEWRRCAPETVAGFSAVGYFFGRELHRDLGLPVGLINTSYGGTRAEAWTRRGALDAVPSLAGLLGHWAELVGAFDPVRARSEFEERLARWEDEAAKARARGEKPPRRPRPPSDPGDSQHRPASLYNGMLAPLVPFAIRGAIWYQGESNASRAHQYRTIFPTMIRNWREDWGGGDFPFYWVQLANFREAVDEPGESDWAELREAQSMTLALPNTGEAVIIDIGEARDIHPRNKQEVGRRLARWALARDYGRDVVPSGPRFRDARFDGKHVRVTFDHVGSGLCFRVGGELTGFTVAGADRKFHRATARIDASGDAVIVTSDAVPEPVAIRYGWADNPRCNLYNLGGLPASPFRSDSWEGLTVGREF